MEVRIISKAIKGLTIEIGGSTKGLSKALADVNQRSTEIQKELSQVSRLLKFNPNDTELLAQKQKLLGEQVEATKEKLEALESAQEEVNKQFAEGKIGEKTYREFQREIIETRSKLGNYENKLKEASEAQNNFGRKIKESSQDLEKFGNKAKNFGSSFSTKVTAPIIAGATLAVEGTREFREELARLDNNATLAGASIEGTRDSLKRLNSISDDSGAIVEALSNLLQSGFTDESLANVVDELSGAVLKFPDTLKIEGLSDGLQETLATGKAIGPFSELLERMGINLEDFNAGLAEASAKGEEHNYILQELNRLGLSEVNESYREMNKELIDSADATFDLKEATAELGKILEPIFTVIKEVIAVLIQKFLELSPATQKIIGVLILLIALIGPLLMMIGTMSLGLSALMASGTALAPVIAALGTVIGAITSPIGILIISIGALVASIVHLWKTNEDFRTFIFELWEEISEFFFETLAWIQETFAFAWEAISKAFSAFGKLFKGDFKGFLNEIWQAAKTWVLGWADIGKNIVTGIWEGISGMASWLAEKVTGFFGSIVDAAKSAVGINSPSTVFRDEIGKNMALGIGVGFSDTMEAVKEAMGDSLKSSTSDTYTDNRISNNSEIKLTQNIYVPIKNERALAREAERNLRKILVSL